MRDVTNVKPNTSIYEMFIARFQRIAYHFTQYTLGLETYVREYTRFIFAMIPLAASALISAAWLYHEISENSEYFEPLIVFLSITAALLLGSYLPIPLSDLRSRRPEPSLEESEDSTTAPWGAVNHSFSQIRWKSEVAMSNRKALQAYINKQYIIVFLPLIQFLSFLFPRDFSILGEHTGTINYRLLSLFETPLLLRIHVADNIVDLRLRYDVLEHIKASMIFEEKYLNAITPKHLRGATNKQFPTYIEGYDEIFAPGKRILFEMFPYVGDLRHFDGRRAGLKSVGEKVGQIQRHISEFCMPSYVIKMKKNRGNTQVDAPIYLDIVAAG